MIIKKGKYNSSTEGLVDAVMVTIGTSVMGIANLNGTPYSFYGDKDFIETKDGSIIFPKVTDHFAQELLEMTIRFKD